MKSRRISLRIEVKRVEDIEVDEERFERSYKLNFWDWITTHFEVEEEKFKEVEEERFERKYKFVTECLMILNAIIVKTFF